MSDGPVLLFGLDGAAWPVIHPLIETGRLPFISCLVQNGFSASLNAPWPWATFPSWTSIMTGTSPGVHGMLDFSILDHKKMKIHFIDSTHRRAPALWEMVTGRGGRCVVLGVPGTYPPDTSAELMISGFDTPVTTSIEPSFIYPESYRRRLIHEVGRFPLTPVQELRITKNWHRKARRALLQSIKEKTEVASFVLKDLEPDLFIIVFGETDTVSHHFWQYYDTTSPRHDTTAPEELKSAIEDVYSAVDTAIAEITEVVGKPRGIVVVSDHGFGGVGHRAIHINRFLAAHDLLSFGTSRMPLFRPGSFAFDMFTHLPRGLQQWIVRHGARQVIPDIESRRRFAGIRWDRTAAYSEELNYAPSVRINCKDREVYGTVESESYESVRQRTKEILESWRDEETGSPIIRRVYRREELLHGPEVHNAPDLLIELAMPNGHSFVVLPSQGETGPSVHELPPDAGAKLTGMQGSHRREGILIATGNEIRARRATSPAVAENVAGLVLHIMGMGLPPWIHDPPENSVEHEIERLSPEAFATRGSVVQGDRLFELERLKRLSDLGYLI